MVSAVARGGVWSTDGAVTCTLALFFVTGLLSAGAGCGGEPGVSDPRPSSPSAGDVAEAVGALASGGTGARPAPRMIYLDYADGTALPKTNVNACRATPPRFHCNFGSSLLDCQRKVQVYLDRWYADFNVVFTLTRPTSGPFDTVVVSSGGGAWCDADPDVAGVAPFLCNNLNGGVVYAFRGGENAWDTAVIMAQEQAHLIGLEHTASPSDLMSPTICTSCDGFESVARSVVGDKCGRGTQTSYQMMLDRLGPWPGGPKPSAFGCQSDSPPPVVQIDEPADHSTVAPDFTVRGDAIGDCAIARVQVDITPEILHASATAPPFKWDLSNITGQQVIAVTAIDQRGRSSSRKIMVTAAATPDTEGSACSISGAERRSRRADTPWLAIAPLAVAALRARRRRRPELPRPDDEEGRLDRAIADRAIAAKRAGARR